MLEILVEEPSAKAALDVLVPMIVPQQEFEVRPFNGKADLLAKVGARMRGYSYLPEPPRVVVLVDRDQEDCHALKSRLVGTIQASGWVPHRAGPLGGVLVRIAIEELESWFLGDVSALRAAYPGVPASLASRAGFRDPDAMTGGTWEALERVLRNAGHHRGGLAKIKAASDIAPHMNIEQNRSTSFRAFRDGLRSLVSSDHKKRT